MNISFFGSSLVSAYWNGAATYYRGIIRQLHARGHRVTFYEPDAFARQEHRDIANPFWCEIVVYSGTDESDVWRVLDRARHADVLVKASGVGVWDELLEEAVPGAKRPGALTVFWDVDAPATLARMRANDDDALRRVVGRYDGVFTYGGGAPVVRGYEELGARACTPIYNALDPGEHYPVSPVERYRCDWRSWRIDCRIARSESKSSFSDRHARCPKRSSSSAGTAGETSTFPTTSAGWGTSTPPSTTRSTRVPGSCSTWRATAWRRWGGPPRHASSRLRERLRVS